MRNRGTKIADVTFDCSIGAGEHKDGVDHRALCDGLKRERVTRDLWCVTRDGLVEVLIVFDKFTASKGNPPMQ